MTQKLDPVVEAVRKDLHERSQLGIKKYGQVLGESKADQRVKLQHALEEALDLANYLKWLIMGIDGESNAYCLQEGHDLVTYDARTNKEIKREKATVE